MKYVRYFAVISLVVVAACVYNSGPGTATINLNRQIDLATDVQGPLQTTTNAASAPATK